MTAGSLANALLFTLCALAVYALALRVTARLLPGVWRQIMEEKNTAAGIVAGALALGLATVVASAFH
jgi:uncharacterized membrane protein YjfL (UPF0719 family)